jgi:hypothetical protein
MTLVREERYVAGQHTMDRFPPAVIPLPSASPGTESVPPLRLPADRDPMYQRARS